MALKKGRYGQLINEQGVKFSKREVNLLNEAVEQANRILQLERSTRQPSVLKRDKAFLEPRRVDIERFYTKDAFKSYLRQTQKIARGTYFREVAIDYRQNYIKSLERNFGDDATKLINKIQRLPLDDFRRLVDNDVVEEIGFFYYDTATSADDKIESTIQAIDNALGIRAVGRPRKNAL